MTLEVGSAAHVTADWLFSISDGRGLPSIDGLAAVVDYDHTGRPPEEVAIIACSTTTTSSNATGVT